MTFLKRKLLSFSCCLLFLLASKSHAEKTNPAAALDLFLDSLQSQLSADSSAVNTELMLIVSVAASLSGQESMTAEEFEGALSQPRLRLVEKLKDMLRERWSGRPRNVSQANAALLSFVRSLWHLIEELPTEIAARTMSGYHEFGLVYLTIVLPTYPVWFFVSENIEHLVLGAPLGLACTHLQLGYFFVVASMMAPVASVCDFVSKDLRPKSWFQKLKETPKNLVLAWQDYLRFRLSRRAYKIHHGESALTSHRELLKSKLSDTEKPFIKSLLKDPVLWQALISVMRNEGENGTVTELDPQFIESYRWARILRFTLDQLQVHTKILREEEHLNFSIYNLFLKAEAVISAEIRKNFVIERKHATQHSESIKLLQRLLSSIQGLRSLQLEADLLDEATLKSRLNDFIAQVSLTCSAPLTLASR